MLLYNIKEITATQQNLLINALRGDQESACTSILKKSIVTLCHQEIPVFDWIP